jgi:hypothetical protein
MMKLPAIVLVCSGSLSSVGCLAEPSAPGPETLGTAAEPLVWGNGDDPDFFWQASSQAALGALAEAPLESGGALASTPLALTTEGQSMLGYVVGCALPAGTSIYSAQAGVSFSGVVGLSPEWTSSPLAYASQRWVTACLLQTLNGLDMHVPIRLSGANPALADQPDAGASSFTVADDTTFGNLFLSGAGAYACSNVVTGLIDGCSMQISMYTLERICGLSPTCGITLLGPCGLSCTAVPGGQTCVDPAGNSYAETIATTLQQTVVLSLYPLCLL